MAERGLSFEAVAPTEDQARVLHGLLDQRRHAISHAGQPGYDAHRAFVFAHPYRAWYIVADGDGPSGAVYLTDRNEVGINMVRGLGPDTVRAVLDYVRGAHEPLPPVASVRGAGFFVNVPMSDDALRAALGALGHVEIQTTFRVG